MLTLLVKVQGFQMKYGMQLFSKFTPGLWTQVQLVSEVFCLFASWNDFDYNLGNGDQNSPRGKCLSHSGSHLCFSSFPGHV